MFSCRLLLGPTVVPYFLCNKGFICLLHFYVSLYSCYFPRLLFVCLCFCYWFFSVLLAFFSLLHFPDVFQSGFWDFDQDALPVGPTQGLAERLKTTILSSNPRCTTALTASGRNLLLIRLTGLFSLLNPFMLHCTCNTLLSNPIPLV